MIILSQDRPCASELSSLSSASPKTESENNRPSAPGTVATLPAVNY